MVLSVAIYLFCLTVGLVFTLISALMGHFFGGADHDGDVSGSGGEAEAGIDGGDMPGVSAFSPTILSSFVTAFGGFGIIFSQFEGTKSPWISAPLSVACAFGIAGLMLGVLRQLFKKTQSSSESHVASLMGQIATVITPIPENGVGEIAYVQAGTRYTAPARTENGTPVPNGQPVRISRVVGTQYYVVPA
jgi:membrane protein implicated in regulation of membrane protease activity